MVWPAPTELPNSVLQLLLIVPFPSIGTFIVAVAGKPELDVPLLMKTPPPLTIRLPCLLRVKVPIQAEFAARFTILLHVVCVPLGSVSVRASLSGRLRLGCGIGCLRQGERWMRCMECGSSAVSERSE